MEGGDGVVEVGAWPAGVVGELPLDQGWDTFTEVECLTGASLIKRQPKTCFSHKCKSRCKVLKQGCVRSVADVAGA